MLLAGQRKGALTGAVQLIDFLRRLSGWWRMPGLCIDGMFYRQDQAEKVFIQEVKGFSAGCCCVNEWCQ